MPLNPTSSSPSSPSKHSFSCLPSFFFAPWRLLCCVARCFKRVFCCSTTPRPSSRTSASHSASQAGSFASSTDDSSKTPSIPSLDPAKVSVWERKEKASGDPKNGLIIGNIRKKEELSSSESEEEGLGAAGSDHVIPDDNSPNPPVLPQESLKENPLPEEEEPIVPSPSASPYEEVSDSVSDLLEEKPSQQEEKPNGPSATLQNESDFLRGLSLPSLPSLPSFPSFFSGKKPDVQEEPSTPNLFDDMVNSVVSLVTGAPPSPSKPPSFSFSSTKVEVISPPPPGHPHPKIMIDDSDNPNSEIPLSSSLNLTNIPSHSSPLGDFLKSSDLLSESEEEPLFLPPLPLPDLVLSPLPPEVILDDSDLWQRESHPHYSLEQLTLITYLADWIPEEVSSVMSVAWDESLEKARKKNKVTSDILRKVLFPDEIRSRKTLLDELLQDPTMITQTLAQIRALEEARDSIISDGSWRNGSSKYSPEAVELLSYLTQRFFYDIKTEDPIRSWTFETLHESNKIEDLEICCYILGCKATTDWGTYWPLLEATFSNPDKVEKALTAAKRVKAYIDQWGDFPAAKQEYLEIPDDLKRSHPHYSAEALELLTYFPDFYIPQEVIVNESEFEDLDRNRAFWQVQRRNALSKGYLYNLLGCMDKRIEGKKDAQKIILRQRCSAALSNILENPQETQQKLAAVRQAQNYMREHGCPPCIGPTRDLVNNIIDIGLGVTMSIFLIPALARLWRLESSGYVLRGADHCSLYSVLLERSLTDRRQLYRNFYDVVYPNSKSIADFLKDKMEGQEIDVDKIIMNLLKKINENDIQVLTAFINGYPDVYQDHGITIELLMEYIRTAQEKMAPYQETKKQLTELKKLRDAEYPKQVEQASLAYREALAKKEDRIAAKTAFDMRKRELDVAQQERKIEIKDLERTLEAQKRDNGMRETITAIGIFMGIAPPSSKKIK